MRGKELWTANAAALATGLVLWLLFRPRHAVPVLGLFLMGMAVVRFFQSRRPPPPNAPRSALFRGFGLLLNGLYGGFFAVLAYYIVLAFSGQIGYPSR
jgi:hypothetical protein